MRSKSVLHRVQYSLADRRIRQQVDRLEAWLRTTASEASDGAPVLFFNASTRIHHLSLNAAFSLLSAWAVRAAGTPVRYLVCRRGLQQCVLGTDADRLEQPPPCELCVRYSSGLFPAELTITLALDDQHAGEKQDRLRQASLEEMSVWTEDGLPLGELCLPGLRWALRRHDLSDDNATRGVFRQYLASASSLAGRLDAVFEQQQPRALVLFNGIMYPEAVAWAVAARRGIPTVTHEVGLKSNSAFFSREHATFREITPLPLAAEQEQELDQYLDQRRSGKFSMAGVRFWPEIRPLPRQVESQLAAGRPMVTVFTNVIFDTSQVHANTLYDDMYGWLADVGQAIKSHPETVFVVRAHPDENRPGKASRQTVAEWFEASGLGSAPNAVLVGPDDYVSSYDLMERSKFVLVYNSSIGLEASILGVSVLCAGKARYTQTETVTLPPSASAYRRLLHDWLAAERIEVPDEFRSNARAFLYYELNHASLDLSGFLSPYPVIPGMVTLRDFEPERLTTSPELSVIRRGLLEGAPFAMRELPEPEMA